MTKAVSKSEFELYLLAAADEAKRADRYARLCANCPAYLDTERECLMREQAYLAIAIGFASR